MQERRNSIANALELRLSWTNPSTCHVLSQVSLVVDNVMPSYSETGMFREIQVSSITADALTPCVVKASDAMVLNQRGKWFLVFHEKGFQITTPSQYRENANIPGQIYISVWQRLSLSLLFIRDRHPMDNGAFLCLNVMWINHGHLLYYEYKPGVIYWSLWSQMCQNSH